MSQGAKVRFLSQDGNRYLYLDDKAVPIEDYKLEAGSYGMARLNVTILLDPAKTNICSEMLGTIKEAPAGKAGATD